MWPFRAKPVVHVDVKKNNPPAPGTTSTLVASYTVVGDPGAPTTLYVDEGAPFAYSKEVTARVKNDVGQHISDEKKRKRLVVKIWRDNTASTNHPVENAITRGILAVLIVEVLAIGVLSALALIYFPDPGSTANGAAFAGLATSGAFMAGHIAARVSKVAQPFEYTKRSSLFVGLSVLVPILLNVLVIANVPELVFEPYYEDWKRMADTASVVIAITGLVTAIIAAAVRGAWDVLKWVIIEEAQRKSVLARTVVDGVENREEVSV